jgi:hypothetical protein
VSLVLGLKPKGSSRRASSQQEGEIMKALNLDQPWAWLVFHGKDIENRDRNTSHRGMLIIRATKTYDTEGEEWVSRNFPRIKIPDNLPTGALVGTVVIADCVTKPKSKWFFGTKKYGYVLKEPSEFKKPFPYSGMPGLFEVPDETVKRIFHREKTFSV